MREFTVELRPYGKSVTVPEGTTLADAARIIGVPIDAPCGGNGTCGKCMVRLLDGETYHEVLSCSTEVHADLTLDVPQNGQHRILTAAADRPLDVRPLIRRKAVVVPPGDGGDRRSEWRRLKGVCGSLDAPANVLLAAELPETLASLKGRGDAVMFEREILALRPPGARLCVMAFDVGTTTIVGWLLDAESGETLALASTLNPQAAFGADVVQRANHALLEGPAGLAGAVRSALDNLVSEAARDAGLAPDDIYVAVVAGNTCMHHLLLGLSPASLVRAPYRPALAEALTLSARGYVHIHPCGKLLVLPNIAGFVGSDTVGVMLAIGLDRSDELTLAIDIGTNGELVLGDGRRMMACSTAAGPAFEGANIACGMRGTTGAIDHVSMEDGGIRLSVIGDGAPQGMCGSGLMDLVAVLLDAGVIEPSGRFAEPEATAFASRMFEKDGQPAFLVAEGVFLTQRDVREVQLAKAAMAAGIRLLAKNMGQRVGDIRRVFVAGAFGNYMDPASACRIGLIPAELEPRVVPVGNAAGAGARMAALSTDEWHRAAGLAKAAEYLDLAADPDFQDCFVDEMGFPERMSGTLEKTDMDGPRPVGKRPREVPGVPDYPALDMQNEGR